MTLPSMIKLASAVALVVPCSARARVDTRARGHVFRAGGIASRANAKPTHHHAPDYTKLDLRHYGGPGNPKPSIVNCTWKYYDTALDNFAHGLKNGSGGATFKLR